MPVKVMDKDGFCVNLEITPKFLLSDVKQRLEQTVGTSVRCESLFYQGKKIEILRTMGSYGIRTHDTIERGLFCLNRQQSCNNCKKCEYQSPRKQFF